MLDRLSPDEWPEAIKRTAEFPDADPRAPWNTDPLYGGMTISARRRSWESAQRSTVGHSTESAPVDLDPPPPSGPEDYYSSTAPAMPAEPKTAKRFTPVAIDAVTLPAEPQWAIDRILPARGLAFIVGPPKSRKSFLAADMLFHLPLAAPYAGRDVMSGPVIYITGEGVSRFKRRCIALRRHYGVEGRGTPFYLVENAPDLGSAQTDLAALVQDIDQMDIQPRAIVLDTLARCMGEGDENTAKDMGRFINRCAALEQHYQCVVVVVHHMGKNPGAGGRGSNAQNGAADVTLTVEKHDTFSTVTITEMKDGPEGQQWSFRLLQTSVSEGGPKQQTKHLLASSN